MKTKLTETKNVKHRHNIIARFLSRIVWAGAVILICSSAWADNLFVSGNTPYNCQGGCGVIYKFTWDGLQSIFASDLSDPLDVAFDGAGNLFVVDHQRGGFVDAGAGAIYKITPSGARTTFAAGVSYSSHLAVDRAGNVFVADYDHGIIYQYKPAGSRGIFASGLYHPTGLAFNSAGDLFVVDNSAGNVYQGSIYRYKPNGSRATVGALQAGDRPADLAVDAIGNLFMADLGGNIYRYDLIGLLRPHSRTTFGAVPGGAQSLAFDSAGNLVVVDAGGVNLTGTAIYKFTQQGVRSMFASAQGRGQSFACLAIQPMACCQ
jgi:DNA-binding beta-propeller fold protein YncE